MVIDDEGVDEGPSVLYQRAAPIGFVLGHDANSAPVVGGWQRSTTTTSTSTSSTSTASSTTSTTRSGSGSSNGGRGSDSRDVEELFLQGDTYSRSHPPPWLAKSSSSSSVGAGGGGGSTLHEEIKAFAQFMSPTPGEKKMREEVIRRISSVITTVWPYAEVNVFGSSASELYLPLSDVDMGVVGAGKNPIFALAAVFRRQGRYHNIETIAKARVPIIKLVDSETNCQVDISFATTANGAVNTAIVKKFCVEAEEIRPLALVLKYYLSQMGLNEPYTGGIGSYTLLLMIISYLQLHRPEGPEGSDLGELLKGFLLLYGRDFNYHRTGISVRNGGCYYQKARRGWGSAEQPWLLSVEDPGDTENDASRSSYGIMEVRACFLNAYRALTSTSGLFESCPSFLARILLRDRRLEHHRSAIRDLYARSDGSSSSSSADRKRTRDQWDQRDQRYRHDDDRSHHRHRRDHDEDERHHTDRYRPRPRTHHGNEAEGGHRRF